MFCNDKSNCQRVLNVGFLLAMVLYGPAWADVGLLDCATYKESCADSFSAVGLRSSVCLWWRSRGVVWWRGALAWGCGPQTYKAVLTAPLRWDSAALCACGGAPVE